MDRWEQIENAYHGARGLHGEDRSRFLDEQRGLDSAMRREVNALLEHDDAPDSFLNRPAVEVAADWESLVGRPAILTGRSVGPYEVLERIGSGGMGDVYRARDRTLKREVALKVLPTLFMLDPDRLARFRREAQVLAALNHPNIAAIHGFEQSDGVQALVLELVEGPTLADRMADGPIPLDEALPIARQIAEALEAAHEQGIVHRDLKPANIKVRPDGTVKVLDFGLAKALEPAVPVGGDVTRSPTITSPASTGMGVLLGTAAYMSPEQAKCRPADKRSDVWAFGCVLYEMLTGRRPFAGEDVSDTLAAVLRGAPDWTAWPKNVPTHIRALVEECLQKDRKDRIGDMSTARFLLKERRAEAPVVLPSPGGGRQPRWTFAAVVATIAVIGAFVGWSVKPSRNEAATGLTRFSIPLGEDQRLTSGGQQQLAISQDGTQIIHIANRRLYVRAMSEPEATPIAGTENSAGVGSPVFSPDGRSVAFWSGSDRTLKRVSVSGGRAVTICQADAPLGMRWGADGLVFGQLQHGILRVSADGGTPEVLVSVNGDEMAYAPQVLPGGRGILFTLASGALLDKPRLVVQTSATGERKTLIEGASDGRYLPTGHIVYAVEGKLLAVSFDASKLEVMSTPVLVLEGIARTGLTTTGSLTGAAQWSVSNTGSLVYLPAPESTYLYSLAVRDRTGITEPLKLPPDTYESPRVSPDGRQIAFGTNDGKSADVWIYDRGGTNAARRITSGGRNRFPTWSPDGQYVAFQSDREGDLAIFRQRADSSGTAERLTKPDSGTSHIPESWSPHGNVLSFSVGKDSRFSLWMLSLPDKHTTPFAAVESIIPTASQFSPDGRWVAYQVGDVSQNLARRVFVQPFPAPGTAYEIPGMGICPLWSADGKQLFYSVAPPTNWVVATVTLRPSFAIGNPVPVPTGGLQVFRPDWWRHYDMARDGKMVGLVIPPGAVMPGTVRMLQVVLNWTEELKARVPVK